MTKKEEEHAAVLVAEGLALMVKNGYSDFRIWRCVEAAVKGARVAMLGYGIEEPQDEGVR